MAKMRVYCNTHSCKFNYGSGCERTRLKINEKGQCLDKDLLSLWYILKNKILQGTHQPKINRKIRVPRLIWPKRQMDPITAELKQEIKNNPHKRYKNVEPVKDKNGTRLC